MSVWEKRELDSFDDLPDLRRQAYVDCIMRKSRQDDIVGGFGENINAPLIYAYGLYLVPIEGIDGYVFKYGDYDSCQLIKSTVVYLKTEKCPLQFSSNIYIVEDFCPVFIKALEDELEKPMYVYKNEDGLKKKLEEVFNKKYSKEKHNEAIAKFEIINKLLDKLSTSDLSNKEYFEIKFFSRYLIDLDERIAFLKEAIEKTSFSNLGKREKVPVLCPGGIYEQIFSHLDNKRYDLVPTMKNPRFSCSGCFVEETIKIDYIGGKNG